MHSGYHAPGYTSTGENGGFKFPASSILSIPESRREYNITNRILKINTQSRFVERVVEAANVLTSLSAA
jgi:hypothetical protein